MPKREIFLCHHSKAAPEVHQLATRLRLRGIVPWVDKQRGGFSIGDESSVEARRVITEDCFGFLFYATRGAIDRWFIRTIELPTAVNAKVLHPGFVLAAFTRGVSFDDLRAASVDKFALDLSAFHGISAPARARREILEAKWDQAAVGVLRKWLSLLDNTDIPAVSVQYSTRQLFPDRVEDILRIDATELVGHCPYSFEAWDQVRRGLVDINAELTHRFQRPRIRVHGSKHLTAAFLFGRVFARNPLDIQQTHNEMWSSDASPMAELPFVSELCLPEQHDRALTIEIASGVKNIKAGVDQLLAEIGNTPARLSLRPARQPLVVDNAAGVAMARQAYREIELAVAKSGASEIHLFVAAHQAFVMMLAQRFSGMPPVHLYEWGGSRYAKSYVVPSGPAGAA